MKKYLAIAIVWTSITTGSFAFNCYYCICEVVLAGAFIAVEGRVLDDKLIPKMEDYVKTLEKQTKLVDHIIESNTNEMINLGDQAHELVKKKAVMDSIRQNHKTATRLRAVEQKIRSIKLRFNFSAKTARELKRINAIDGR